jgi:26S proteasome regulatory subunit N8
VNGASNGSQQGGSELAHAMSVKTNDQLMAIYLSSLIRAITAFHDLIENKIQNRQQQEEKDGKKEEDGKDEKDKKTNGVSGVSAETKEGEKKDEKEKKK